MIRIIRDSERFATEYLGSTFYYRRISAGKARELQRNHIKKGVLDHAGYGLAIVQYCLLDWEGVGEGSGEESIPFSKDLIELMPEEVINYLSPKFVAGSPEMDEDELGN